MVGFVGVRSVVHNTSMQQLNEELNVGIRVITELIDQNSQDMVNASKVMAADFALRAAIATDDRETVKSAFENHAYRINAVAIDYINTDGNLALNSMGIEVDAHKFLTPLVEKANDEGYAVGYQVFNKNLYKVVALPVRAPITIGWIISYFYVGNEYTNRLNAITDLQVTLVHQSKEGGLSVVASSLGKLVTSIDQDLLQQIIFTKDRKLINLQGELEEFASVILNDDTASDDQFFLVLNKSFADALAPYDPLLYGLGILFFLSLAVTFFGANLIARQISKPIEQLVTRANDISDGHYQGQLDIRGYDEIGVLADAFNHLSQGLFERDRVRDVLGKVTSPAIASQLMASEINLGGEERVVTILFADIRNFTTICEMLTPSQSLEFLNKYLGIMNVIIEKHNGLVDKFTGDGLMALFGAPIASENDATNAVLAALEIASTIKEKSDNDLGIQIEVGIGINTAKVIAGNIGSESRLNYTVLGDGVNLASRFEGLTKRYRVPIVVGEDTYQTADGFIYRELDQVRPKGKKLAVRIFEPIALDGTLEQHALDTISKYKSGLEAFRDKRWAEAESIFADIQSIPTYERLSEIYIGYIENLRKKDSNDDWDGVFNLYEK